jgi:N6-L-threonylcarbamoyladenine synthase
VPELASRAHQQNIVPVVEMALRKAGVDKKQLSAIAFARGPGHNGSLMVGCSFSKSQAHAHEIPLIGVHHMQAHVLAHFIDEPHPAFPFLCLTVSGGHTQIVQMNDYFSGELLGSTIDDAAGEAFDKAAKMLGLPYPGGPLVDKFAAGGNPRAFAFPEPRIPELDYSFSGLKTAYLYFLQKHVAADPAFIKNNISDLCASVQASITGHLMKKLIAAAKQTGITRIALAGGVSANSALRKAVNEAGQKYGWQTFIPDFAYCTDNAAMIAIAAYYKYLAGDFETLETAPFAR